MESEYSTFISAHTAESSVLIASMMGVVLKNVSRQEHKSCLLLPQVPHVVLIQATLVYQYVEISKSLF